MGAQVTCGNSFADLSMEVGIYLVGEITKKIVWTCLVEDPSLFMRHFLEKLTSKERQVHDLGFWLKCYACDIHKPQICYRLRNHKTVM